MDAQKTELVGVVFPKEWLDKIDAYIKDKPMTNRQDFIREAVEEKLKALEA